MDNQIQEGELVSPPTLTPTPNLTPTPQPQARTMDFPDAMREIINGKKVTRVEWGNTDYGFLDGEWLSIFTKGAVHVWKVNDGDMEGRDWMVVKELSATN